MQNRQTVGGDLVGADAAAAVFIDIIGRPVTPMSFAGAYRKMEPAAGRQVTSRQHHGRIAVADLCLSLQTVDCCQMFVFA
jgi:hypothetical protein